MDFESKQNTQSETTPKAKPKEEEKPDPKADLSKEQRSVKFLLKKLKTFKLLIEK